MMIAANPIPLNTVAMSELGERLKAARDARQEAVETLADRLLISKNQLLGLEAGNLHYFYSGRHYLQLVRKYCACLDLPFPDNLMIDENAPLASAPVAAVEAPRSQAAPPETSVAESVVEPSAQSAPSMPAPVDPEPVFTDALPTPASAAFDTPKTQTADTMANSVRMTEEIAFPMADRAARKSRWPLYLLVLIAAGAATWFWGLPEDLRASLISQVSPQSATVSVPAASEPAQQPAEQPTPASAAANEPAPAAAKPAEVSNAADAPTLQLAFTGRVWIQAVYRDGKRFDKTYKDGDTLSLTAADLQALVLGNGEYVKISRGDKVVDLEPFRPASGSTVMRIIGERARNLGL